jgi:AraC-like DNA-binding protein
MSLDLRPGPLRYALGAYREYNVPVLLGTFAEGVWAHAVPPGPCAIGMHRVLPDPSINLAFRCIRSASGCATAPRLVVMGPKTRPFVFRFEEGHELAAVRVKLEWARYLLDLDPADHVDAEHELAEIHPREAARMLEALAATRSVWAALAELTAAVARLGRTHLGTEQSGPHAAGAALDLVRATVGRLTVASVAQRVGLPLRQLRRAVRAESAVSLKAYARMTRLNGAMTGADAAVRPSWARVAAEAGFCDQSHLVRECRRLTGLAPGRIHGERRAQADVSPSQVIGLSAARIAARRGSRNGGSATCSPSVAGSSSTANPGPSVAISNRMPLGSRK